MSVVPLQQAKAFLKIEANTNDTLLQGYIDAAQKNIERKVGYLEESGPFTERVTPNGGSFMLSELPVLEIVSVTPADGSPLDVAELYPDPESGVVTMNNGTDFYGRYFTVVYKAGRVDLDEEHDLIQAVKERLRELWSGSQRGAGKPPGPPGPGRPSNTVPGSEQKLSDTVTSLIQDHLLDGFA